jgi:hypothetical protein
MWSIFHREKRVPSAHACWPCPCTASPEVRSGGRRRRLSVMSFAADADSSPRVGTACGATRRPAADLRVRPTRPRADARLGLPIRFEAKCAAHAALLRAGLEIGGVDADERRQRHPASKGAQLSSCPAPHRGSDESALDLEGSGRWWSCARSGSPGTAGEAAGEDCVRRVHCRRAATRGRASAPHARITGYEAASAAATQTATAVQSAPAALAGERRSSTLALGDDCRRRSTIMNRARRARRLAAQHAARAASPPRVSLLPKNRDAPTRRG